MVTHVLFESSSGYAIFEAKLTEDIGSRSSAVQESIKDLAKFGKMVSLMSFSPFKSAAQALENINDISEGAYRTIYWLVNVLILTKITRYHERLPQKFVGVEPL